MSLIIGGQIIQFMKYLVSGFKASTIIKLDKDSGEEQDIIQSDIQEWKSSQVQSNHRCTTNKSNNSKTWRITPIRKVPPVSSKPQKVSKIEQIQIGDESEEEKQNDFQSQIEIVYTKNVEKKKQIFKKRLVKVSNKCKIEGKQYSSTQCSICLSSIENKQNSQIGRLDCKHAFCFDCIYQSSKFSNKCPYCRASFFNINKNGKLIKVEQRNLQEDYDLQEEPCYVCGRNNDFDHLLECQYCEAAFCHTYCDNRLDSDIPPQQSWYCLSCENLLSNS